MTPSNPATIDRPTIDPATIDPATVGPTTIDATTIQAATIQAATIVPTTGDPAAGAGARLGMQSALYEGVVGHRRLQPIVHAFRTPVLMAYLDLAELPEALDAHPLWSARRWAPVRFRRADHHGDPAIPLDRAVRDTIEARTGTRPVGPVRMLAQLRAFGWSFNPITLYFAFDATGTRAEVVLAEVTNTPWHERHAYVLPLGPPADAATVGVRFAKELHVSPFMDMDLDHRLVLSPPGADHVTVRMEDRRGDDLLFEAELDLHRLPLDRRTMGAALRRHVLPAHRTSAGIYWQALVLRLKGAPFRRHPSPPTRRHRAAGLSWPSLVARVKGSSLGHHPSPPSRPRPSTASGCPGHPRRTP